MNPTPERKNWDDYTVFEDLGESMYNMTVKMPMLPAFVFTIKVLVARDFPNAGDITWVYRSFDPATGALVTTSGAPVGKGCALAVEGQPSKCMMHSIDSMPSMMSWMPAFMVRWMLSQTPKMTMK